MKTAIHFFAVAFALVALTCDSRAYSQLVEPSTPVGGVSQAEWVARWGQWYLSFPNDRRPETSDFSYLGDQGPVFFLAAPGREPQITFDVIIDNEDYVFLNLMSIWVFADDPSTQPEWLLREQSAQAIDEVDTLFLEIDGVSESDLWGHRQTTPPGLVDVTLPDDNIFSVSPGVHKSVFEGYYVMLEPLALGEHEIHFGGSVRGREISTLAIVMVVPALLPGDFDADGNLSVADINLLTAEVAEAIRDPYFDLNFDTLVDGEDLRIWVKELKTTWFGDADLDGEFNSSDMVQVFAAGKYETGEAAGWADGDWDGNGFFDSSDMITAFADGGYEKGPRTDAVAVPEPASALLFLGSLVVMTTRRRRFDP